MSDTYNGIDNDRLVKILQSYVINDYEGVLDTSYIRDVLLCECGCTRDEIEWLGLGFVLDTEER